MQEYSKSVHKRLRQLASKAYEAELGRELAQLHANFGEWQQGRITVWELSDLIHRFHNGPSRELYGMYNNLEADLMVARAVVWGLLSEDDVPQEARPRIRELMTLYDTPPDSHASPA